MTDHRARYGPHAPGATYVGHELTYLGDPAYAPVWAELERRRARAFIHPTSPPCWEHTSHGRPRPMIEFLFDTTRAVAGATLPMVADRVSVFSLLLDAGPEVDALLTIVAPQHLHYGSDYPFTPEVAADASLRRLADVGDPPGSLLAGLRANTERLLGRT